MKSLKAKKVVAIYSIIFALLNLLNRATGQELGTFYVFLPIAMLIVSIILLMPGMQKAEKGLMIALLSLYSLFMLSGVISLLVIPLVGLIVIVMIVVPFAYSINYFKNRKQELLIQNENNDHQSQYNSDYSTPEQENRTDEDILAQKLKSLYQMVTDGLITRDDYEAKKNELLNIRR